MNKNILLIVGFIMIVFGLSKPNMSTIVPNSTISTPVDSVLKQEADDVVKAASSKLSTKEAKDLRDLYIGLATLIKLDGDDKIVTSTDHIRQANSIGGRLLHLDLKGKYPELVKENNDIIVKAIGDDNVSLTGELRNKAFDAFMALAWAYNETIN